MKFMKVMLINLLVLIAGLLLIEVIFGGWLSDKNKLDNLGIMRNVKLRYPVTLYPSSFKEITYTRDQYGLRGSSTFDKPAMIDLLTIGGSTTDQRYVDDIRTWQAIFENGSRKSGNHIRVSNAGVDGQSTFGHIKNFEVWFPLVPGLKPRYILFYIGINDFYRISDDSRYDDLQQTNVKFSYIKNNSVLYNAYRKIIGSRNAKRAGVVHTKVDFATVQYTRSGIAVQQLKKMYLRDNLVPFKRRIEKLIDLTKAMGAEPIFVTQPTRVYKFINGKLYGTLKPGLLNGFSYNGVDYYLFLCAMNKVIEEAAGRYTVVDLTNNRSWQDSDFYDVFHMTEAGAQKAGEIMYEQLKDKLR